MGQFRLSAQSEITEIKIKGENAMQFNIQNYEVETILFAHVLPVNREYTIIVFVGRKPNATLNRIIFALLKAENGETTVADEISVPSCEAIRENTEILLASESVNIHFTIVNKTTVDVSYIDTDYCSASTKEHFNLKLQSN